jgi:hypothetical protein
MGICIQQRRPLEVFMLYRLPSDNSTVKPKPIKAKLIGSRTCSAAGLTSCANQPVFELCRMLVEAGHDPDRPLEAYRGKILALVVASIGYGAHLTINSKGTRFCWLQEVRTASLVQKSAKVDPKPQNPVFDRVGVTAPDLNRVRGVP